MQCAYCCSPCKKIPCRVCGAEKLEYDVLEKRTLRANRKTKNSQDTFEIIFAIIGIIACIICGLLSYL